MASKPVVPARSRLHIANEHMHLDKYKCQPNEHHRLSNRRRLQGEYTPSASQPIISSSHCHSVHPVLVIRPSPLMLQCKCMQQDIAIYLTKAVESLLTAETESINGRYNSCANRCYYACFQAAITALLMEGIRPAGQWNHQFVQAQFVGVLINQRKRYDTELRRVLSDNQSLRDKADYRPEFVTATQASRALRRTRLLVTTIRQRGGVAS